MRWCTAKRWGLRAGYMMFSIPMATCNTVPVPPQLLVLTFKCVGAALASLARLTRPPAPSSSPDLSPCSAADAAAAAAAGSSGPLGDDDVLSALLPELTSVADLERETRGGMGGLAAGGGAGGAGAGGGGVGVLPAPLVGYVIHSCLQAATAQLDAGAAGASHLVGALYGTKTGWCAIVGCAWQPCIPSNNPPCLSACAM